MPRPRPPGGGRRGRPVRPPPPVERTGGAGGQSPPARGVGPGGVVPDAHRPRAGGVLLPGDGRRDRAAAGRGGPGGAPRAGGAGGAARGRGARRLKATPCRAGERVSFDRRCRVVGRPLALAWHDPRIGHPPPQKRNGALPMHQLTHLPHV